MGEPARERDFYAVAIERVLVEKGMILGYFVDDGRCMKRPSQEGERALGANTTVDGLGRRAVAQHLS
jgi:hypothetical protein